MRYRFTPLLLVSIGLVLFALFSVVWMLFDSEDHNLSGLFPILFFIAAVVSMELSKWLHKIFKANVWRQTLLELLLIVAVGFFFYKKTGKVVLHIPPNYQGYIFVVYGVTNQAPLQRKSFLKAHIHVSVPTSGIFFTSSKRSGTLAISDNLNGEVKTFGSGIVLPNTWDTLRCGTKAYFMNVLFVGPVTPGWNYQSDSVTRNLRKEQICKMLSTQ